MVTDGKNICFDTFLFNLINYLAQVCLLCKVCIGKYSVFHKSIAPPDFSGNQGNQQNFEKSLVPHIL